MVSLSPSTHTPLLTTVAFISNQGCCTEGMDHFKFLYHINKYKKPVSHRKIQKEHREREDIMIKYKNRLNKVHPLVYTEAG